jgi:hypothetical protein
MCRRPAILSFLALATVLSACADDGGTPLGSDFEAFLPNAQLGMEAFRAECASCHASGDGFDLAIFSFPDSTIIRRALGHVPIETAENIVAHIRTIGVSGFTRDTRVFQPGGRVLPDDRTFALELFGEDAWPAEMTTEGLRAIDPLDVLIAVGLPIWSVEESNTDWMPEVPVDSGILVARGAAEAEAEYRAVPTDENLLRTTYLLRVTSRDSRNADAPCLFQDEARVQYERCFELQRWIATLGAQHMLRVGAERGLHELVHDAFWDIGQTVRRSMVLGGIPFENGHENWASWMWLGWMFEPGNHASFYTAKGMQNFGLVRHAAFVGLRSMVDREVGSRQPYEDVQVAVGFAPNHWAGNVAAFGFRHLIERLEAGDVPTQFPPDQDMDDLRRNVVRAFQVASVKDPESPATLEPLMARVLELMPDGQVD